MRHKRKGSPSVDIKPRAQVIRIDKLLWFLRFTRNRNIAKKLSVKGHVRLNGRRVDRAHTNVRAGDILTIPRGREVHVIRISRLPERRGPVASAHACYEKLQTGKSN